MEGVLLSSHAALVWLSKDRLSALLYCSAQSPGAHVE